MTSNFMVLLLFVVSVNVSHQDRCGNCAYMIWGCNCDTVTYCLKKQCTVKPQCLTQCGATEGGKVESTTKQPMTEASATTKRPGAGGVTEGGEVESTTKQPMTVSVTTGGTKSPVTSATTKRPGADRCGNCAYMIWGCDCATVSYCLKKQCTVKPQCLTQCGVTEGGEVETTRKQPMTVSATTSGTKSPVASATTKRPRADPCGNCAYMIWGCNCATVNFCLKKQCTVKPQCLTQCGVTEGGKVKTTTKQLPVTKKIVPLTEKIVPVTAKAGGRSNVVECQYCELMYWGCICDDVNYCLNKWNCPVKPLCLKKCGVTDGGKVKTTTKQPPLTEKIIPVTVERKHRIECQYCELMYWGCFCNGVNHCLNKWNCPVKPLCLKKCGLK